MCKGMQRLLQDWGAEVVRGAPGSWSLGAVAQDSCLQQRLLCLLLLRQAVLKLCPSHWSCIISATVRGLFPYTHELFRSGPKSQLVGVAVWGQEALERRQLAVCRAVRKLLSGLAELMSGTFPFITPALLIYHEVTPRPLLPQLLHVLGSVQFLTVFYLYHCYKY